MKKRIFICGWIFLFSIFLFLCYQITNQEILSIDSFFIEHIVLNGRSDNLTVFFKIITFFSSVILLLVLTILIFVLLKKKEEKMYFLGQFLGVVAISQGLKFFFQRERPLLLYRLVEETGFSFPSGHSMVGSAFYGYLIYLLSKSKLPKRKRILFSVVLTILIVGIGFSRIYLGVHYASDVLAGVVLGICYTSLFVIYKEYKDKMKKKSLLKSFYHAGIGIYSAFLSERNMKIHVSVMLLVILAGIYFQISFQEWMICIILFGVVISAEIMNTAVETTVDLAMPKLHPKAKLAKDLAAGAVLVLAIIAVVIGLMIFLPKVSG